MPIVLPKDIPAFEIMEKENVFVMSRTRAEMQDIRPIEIAIVNLMPTKIETETQFIRLLSNSPLQINLTLVTTESYIGTHTSQTHLDKFYHRFSEIKNRKFDGMIITGAPVEQLDFEEVKYWDEMQDILAFADSSVTTTMYICWAAQASLYYHYGVHKQTFDKKLFGVYKHKRIDDFEQLFKGVDDVFYIPQSRHTGIIAEEVKRIAELQILAESDETGLSIIKSKDNRKFFITGHLEYDKDTLDKEYKRDLEKKLPIQEPVNYYKDGAIEVRWRSTANVVFTNWLNYYVYQVTPFKLEDK